MDELGVDREDGVVVRQQKGGDVGEQREYLEYCDKVFISGSFLCLLKDVILNSSGDGLVEHGIDGLGVLNGMIVGTGKNCVCSVGGEDQLVFG